MSSLPNNKIIMIIGSAVLALTLVFAAFFLFKIYYFDSEEDSALIEEYEKKDEEIKKRFEKLDAGLIEDEKYKELKDSQVKKINIEDLKVGKENPFDSPEEDSKK